MKIITSISIYSYKKSDILSDLFSQLVPHYTKNYQVLKQENKIIILKKKKQSTNFSENNRSILRVFNHIEIETNENKSNLMIKFSLSYLVAFSVIVFIITNFFGLIYGYTTMKSIITLNLLVLTFLILFSVSKLRKHIQFIKKSIQEVKN